MAKQNILDIGCGMGQHAKQNYIPSNGVTLVSTSDMFGKGLRVKNVCTGQCKRVHFK